jgi:hypothetical protein
VFRALLLGTLFLLVSAEGWGQTIPIAVDDEGAICVNTSLDGDVSANDTLSTDGGNVWNLIGEDGGALNGSVNMNSNGTFTYTPDNDFIGTDVFSYQLCDIDNDCSQAQVTITINNNLPVSVTISASANPVCSGTSVTYTATPVNGGTTPAYQWKVNGTNVGTNSSTYTYTPSNGDAVTCVMTSNATCATDNPATSNTITMEVNPLPLPVITGPSTACTASSGNIYTTAAGMSNYTWIISAGGSITAGGGTTSNSVTVTWNSTGAQSVSVNYTNTNGCRAAVPTVYAVTVSDCFKTLNLKIFLEGLFNGIDGMVKAQGCDDGENPYDMFPGSITDTLTIQLAETNDPYEIIHSEHAVPVNTDGTISINTIPASLSGNYYIIIKHRNHVETWSQVVSFAGGIINYNFTDAISKAWGNNMIRVGTYYCIYTGDTNGDQYVDGFDLAITFNLNKKGSFDYQVSDINGDGFIDGFDLVKVFNNNKKGVGMNTPIAPW